MRKFALAVVSTLALALPAAADPILNVSTSSIAAFPTQTVITFSVQPNGTPVSALVLNFAALAAGLTIVGGASLDGDITFSPPQLNAGSWETGFGGLFLLADRTAPFDVGTLTLEGLVPGTPLVVTGNFTDSSFNDIPVGPSNVAVVTPEPGSAALLAAGVALLALGRRGRTAA